MTPEAIAKLEDLREAFLKQFAAKMPATVKISKGKSLVFNPSMASLGIWVDDQNRLNYVQVYAHTAPDQLFPDRPLTIRVAVNPQYGATPKATGSKSGPQLNQDWRWELTALPEEVLDFAPWLVSWLAAHGQDADLPAQPPHPLKFIPTTTGISEVAWTQAAWDDLADDADYQAA